MYLQSLYTCREKKKQLYFNVVLIYTDNKVKLKEGKRRNGFAIEFFFSPAKEMNVDNKGGMFIRDTLQRGNQSVTFINEERDVLKWNTLSQVEFSIGIQKNARCCR